MADEDEEPGSDRLSPEELSALFAPPDADEDSHDAAGPGPDAGGGGLPPDLFGLLEALASRTFFAGFEDLDDFLDATIDLGSIAVSAARARELAREAGAGVSLELALQGAPGGRVWFVLADPAARSFLGLVLGAEGGGPVTGALGPLHEAALEAPAEELGACVGRHLDDEPGIDTAVGAITPRLGGPSLDPETHLLRLECAARLEEADAPVVLYLDEDLAIALGEVERQAGPGRAASEPASDDLGGGSESGEDGSSGRGRAGASRRAAAPPHLEVLLGHAADPGPLTLGQVVRLDRLAGARVVLRRGRERVGEGRVVVDDDHYAVRVEVLEPESGGGA